MRKVLVIGYFWPYRGGSGRMWGLAKYLSGLSWEPIILTAPLERKSELPCEVIETYYPGDIFSKWRRLFGCLGFNTRGSVKEQIKEHFGLKSEKSILDNLVTYYHELFAYPDTEKAWKEPALKAVSKLLKNENIQAMISVWPITSHLIAKALKQKYNIPWIADFPDPWSQNHNYPYSKVRKYFDEKLELKTCSVVDAMTAAAPLYAKKQEYFHKRPVAVITNGFEPEDLYGLRTSLTDKFTLTYTGTIYTGKQDPEKVLIALKKLIFKGAMKREDVEVRFYGQRQIGLESKITEHQLVGIVRQFNFISRHESIQKQRESHLLLLFNWEDPNEKGVYPLKFFEYLAARRPILATGGYPEDDIEKLIVQAKAGRYASTIKEIEASILSYYEEYKRTQGVSYQGDSEEINKYSYPEMAKKFGAILNQITEK